MTIPEYDADSETRKLSEWRIEYEIPPFRAIYHGYAVACSEAEARDVFQKEGPGLAVIRKIEQV